MKNPILYLSLSAGLLLSTGLTGAITAMSDLVWVTDGTTKQSEVTSFQLASGGVDYSPTSIAQITSSVSANDVGWHLGDTDLSGEPASLAAAVNDIYATTNVWNMALAGNPEFDLGTTLNDGDGSVIYLIEHGAGIDGITVQPMDAGGIIADWSLTIVAGDYGVISDTSIYDWNNEGNPLVGVSFSLADFSGGVGTLTGVTGIALGSGSATSIDLAQVGVAAVPEPAAIALAFGFICLGLIIRRRLGA